MFGWYRILASLAITMRGVTLEWWWGSKTNPSLGVEFRFGPERCLFNYDTYFKPILWLTIWCKLTHFFTHTIHWSGDEGAPIPAAKAKDWKSRKLFRVVPDKLGSHAIWIYQKWTLGQLGQYQNMDKSNLCRFCILALISSWTVDSGTTVQKRPRGPK